jgi:hypothetical protein
MAKKSSLQNNVEKLQYHFKGEMSEQQVNSGDWSPESIAENRRRYTQKETPWVLEGIGCYDYYLKHIKPKQASATT